MVELGCMWHFAEMGANAGDEGPNSAMSQTFAQFPCAALVRESIQNSLDAVLNDEEPVVVCFEHGRISKFNYRNFFGVSEHIKACRDYYRGNKSANAIYPAMLDKLNASDYIGYIKVSDYNTKGMDYEASATDKSFYAFVRAAGVSVKPAEGSGGSFGFGKGAFFVMSPLNTLMVSTWNKEGKSYFEGVTRLCSHMTDGVKRSHMGFYDNNDGMPISDPDRIPTAFKRTEAGTSISIMGVERDSWVESRDDLAREVLANFFVAILRGKLEVYIDGSKNNCGKDTVVINSETIGGLMSRYFPTFKEVNRKNKFNPRPYYEAMVGDDSLCFEEELPTLGKVALHLKEFEGNVTQIIFMRKLLMKVYRDRNSLGNYNGVFICENPIGNKILRDMEDPEHKSWDKEQCKKDDIDTEYETALRAEEEISKFLNDVLEELLNISATDSVQISGLEKYLPSQDGIKGKGEKGNPFTGRPTGNYIPEGVSRTTEGQLEEPKKRSRRNKGQVIEVADGSFKQDPEGNQIGGTNPNPNHGSGGHGSSPGDNFGHGDIDNENEGKHYRLIDVEWRPVLTSFKKGYTDIIIYPPKNIKDAVLKFEIGRESSSGRGSKEDVSITYSSKGACDGMKITGVDLTGKARNIIRIAFSDNMYHTLMLAVYEAD